MNPFLPHNIARSDASDSHTSLQSLEAHRAESSSSVDLLSSPIQVNALRDMREPASACFFSLIHELDDKAIIIQQVINAKEKSLTTREPIGRFGLSHPLNHTFWMNKELSPFLIDQFAEAVSLEFLGETPDHPPQKNWQDFYIYLKENIDFQETRNLIIDSCGFLSLADRLKVSYPDEVKNSLAEFPPEKEELHCVPGTRLRLIRAIERLNYLEGGPAEDWICQSMLQTFNEYVDKSLIDCDLNSLVDENYQVHLVSLMGHILGVPEEAIKTKDIFFKTPICDVPAGIVLDIIQYFDCYLHEKSENTKKKVKEIVGDFLVLIEKRNFESPEYFEAIKENAFTALIKTYKHDFNLVSEPFIKIDEQGDIDLNEGEIANLIHSTLFEEFFNFKEVENSQLITFDQLFDEENDETVLRGFNSDDLSQIKKSIDILYLLSEDFSNKSPLLFLRLMVKMVDKATIKSLDDFIALIEQKMKNRHEKLFEKHAFLCEKLNFIEDKCKFYLNKTEFKDYFSHFFGEALKIKRQNRIVFFVKNNAPLSDFIKHDEFLFHSLAKSITQDDPPLFRKNIEKTKDLFCFMFASFLERGFTLNQLCRVDEHHKLPFEYAPAPLAETMAQSYFQEAFKQKELPLLSAILDTDIQLTAANVFTHNKKKKCHPVFIESVALLDLLFNHGFELSQLLTAHPRHGSLLYAASIKNRGDILGWFLEKGVSLDYFHEETLKNISNDKPTDL